MKRLLIILLTSCPLLLLAVDTLRVDSTVSHKNSVRLIIDDMPNAVVHQDSSITRLMLEKYYGTQREAIRKVGFRVQVYSSNDPQSAKNEAFLLQQELIPSVNVEVYVLSEPPFWKVRLGDFKTRDEAKKYKEVINELFPDLYGSTYVVTDKVKIMYKL